METNINKNVELLATAYRDAFHANPTAESLQQLHWSLSRVSEQNQYDLVAAIILECYESRNHGTDDDVMNHDIRKIIWRVTKSVKASTFPTIGFDDAVSSDVYPTRDPAIRQMEDRDQLSSIMSAINELDERDKLILMMGLEDCSTETIASAVETSESNVRQRRKRAIHKIRKILGIHPEET